jgi:hypothetical protein
VLGCLEHQFYKVQGVSSLGEELFPSEVAVVWGEVLYYLYYNSIFITSCKVLFLKVCFKMPSLWYITLQYLNRIFIWFVDNQFQCMKNISDVITLILNCSMYIKASNIDQQYWFLLSLSGYWGPFHWGMKLRLRMSGAVPLFLHIPSFCCKGTPLS